jgi:hypothetical protein
MEVPTPVVVVCDDVLVFEDVKVAERYLEPSALEEPLRIFDRNGRLLRASVERGFLGNEVVRIIEDPEASTYANELREALLRLLRAAEPDAISAHSSLSVPELFEKAFKYPTR